jgi:hypothetical protein
MMGNLHKFLCKINVIINKFQNKSILNLGKETFLSLFCLFINTYSTKFILL